MPSRSTLLGGHSLRQLRELPVLLLAWLVFWLPGRLWRRDPRRVVVVGRDDGRFIDNAKYFFLHGVRAGQAVVFVTEDPRTRDALEAHGAAAVLYPSLRAFRLLLSAGIVVADSAEWVRNGRFQLLAGAKRVQLWHGVPLKGIELAVLEERLSRMGTLARALYRAYVAFFSRYPHYDLVVSTSAWFTQRAFAPSFRARRVIESGYPRNDTLAPSRGEGSAGPGWINTDGAALARVHRLRDAGHRVVLYAPTFRTHGRNPLDGVLDRAALQSFAERHRLCFVIKLHPVLAGGSALAALSNVVQYAAEADIYPVLREVDLLVTDYSSIYFDFLLRDRPIVFFAYDLEEYLARERQLLFPYADMTPGPVTRTQSELERTIAGILEGKDAFAEARARVRALAFDHPAGGAAERVWAELAVKPGASA